MEDQYQDFNSIRSVDERTYPRPIASVYRRCRVTSRQDYGGQHKNLIDLLEVLIKFFAISALAEARLHINNFSDRLPQKEKSLEFLRRPSIGGWVGLLRSLCSFETTPGLRIIPLIAEWYNRSKQEDNRAALQKLAQIEGLNFNTSSKKPHAELLNGLVTYRNKQLAHGARFTDEEMELRLDVLKSVLGYLLDSARFLQQFQLLHIERVEITEKKEYQIEALQLNGSTEEPVNMVSPSEVELHELYLHVSDADVRDFNRSVALSPFLLWKYNEKTKSSELFFYNDAWKTKLEYLSYESGAYFYHKELHRAFEELLSLKLADSGMEDDVSHLSTEERAARAEELYKRATFQSSQSHYEEALEMLEQAAVYERRADIFCQMATIQHELGELNETVEQTVLKALEIDPDNPSALALQSELRREKGEGGNKAVNTAGSSAPVIEHPTLLHALAPPRARKWASLFWFILGAGFYSLAALVEWFWGDPHFSLICMMVLALYTGVVVMVSIARRVTITVRVPLSLQLDSMRLNRFNEWFKDEMDLIFGKYSYTPRGTLAVTASMRTEPFVWTAWAMWTVVLSVGAIYLTEAVGPFIFTTLRIAVVLLLWGIGFAAARTVIGLLFFMYHYGELSLKPMISRLANEGLRAFAPIMLLLVVGGTVTFGLLILVALEGVQIAGYYDFYFLAEATALILALSFGLPIMLQRSGKMARQK